MSVDVLTASRAAPSVTLQLGSVSFTLPTISKMSIQEAIEHVEYLASPMGLEYLIGEALKDDAAGRAEVLSSLTGGVAKKIISSIEEASGMTLYDVILVRQFITAHPEAVSEDLNRAGKTFAGYLEEPAWSASLWMKASITSTVERSSIQSAERGEVRPYGLSDWILSDLYRLTLYSLTRGKSSDYARLPVPSDNANKDDLERELHKLNEGAQFENLSPEQIDLYMDTLIKVQTGVLPVEALSPWRENPPL